MEFRDLSAAAFERLARRQVERALEGLPDDPDVPLPLIGRFPHERAVQKQVMVAALIATRWFEFEAPPWAQPLPLKVEACQALFNLPLRDGYRAHRRASLVGRYGLMLRGRWWDLTHVTPFEVYSQDAR